MQEFFRIGGFSMFPVLAVGLAALVAAIASSGRPRAAWVTLAHRLALAELFFALTGLATNLAATCRTVSVQARGEIDAAMLLEGLYESSAPVIMGFAFLALTYLALGVAEFRLARAAS